jgi:YfiH family protein
MAETPPLAALEVITLEALAAIPGLVHGFERRQGPAGWETLLATRERVARQLRPFGELHLLRQVHGATVREAPWQGRLEGDASFSERAGQLLGILTADCLPILIVDPERRVAAAAHAGWRGTAAGVARALVGKLVERGSRPAELVAGLGPANQACCYEVGAELKAAFGEDARKLFQTLPNGRLHLDVPLANRRQLEAMGLIPARIHALKDCTFCRPDLYHSYRREGPGGEADEAQHASAAPG